MISIVVWNERLETINRFCPRYVIGLAGFVPNLVTPVQHLVNSYQWALIFLFPGLYVLSSVLFLLTLITVQFVCKFVAWDVFVDVDFVCRFVETKSVRRYEAQ